MRRVLVIAAIAEIATGLALLIAPSWVGQWLLGQPLDGIAADIARLTGIALIALGIACWPGSPQLGMLVYSALVTVGLAHFGLTVATPGVLLWPATALHLVLTVLLAIGLWRRQ